MPAAGLGEDLARFVAGVDPTVSDAPTIEIPDIGSQAETASAPAAKPAPPVGGYWWGTGRRKTAVARVRIKTGSGKFLIQGREIENYFFDERWRAGVVAPLKSTKSEGKFDVFVNVRGGGQTGQSGAIAMGVARALVKADPTLEPTLRDGKYLTRDSRKVERKKPGQPGARKRFQFSKR